MVTKYTKYSGCNDWLTGPPEPYQAVVLKQLKGYFTHSGRGGCTWVVAEDSGFCLLAFFQVSSGSNYSPHLTILSSLHCLGCQTISKVTYRSTESQRILDLALMCPIRQLMSSMRAQVSLGQTEPVSRVLVISLAFSCPFKNCNAPFCSQRISKWRKLLFPHYFSHWSYFWQKMTLKAKFCFCIELKPVVLSQKR